MLIGEALMAIWFLKVCFYRRLYTCYLYNKLWDIFGESIWMLRCVKCSDRDCRISHWSPPCSDHTHTLIDGPEPILYLWLPVIAKSSNNVTLNFLDYCKTPNFQCRFKVRFFFTKWTNSLLINFANFIPAPRWNKQDIWPVKIFATIYFRDF